MSEPAQKCENNCAIFSKTCCFGLRRKQEFPDFLQKKFYNINSRMIFAKNR